VQRLVPEEVDTLDGVSASRSMVVGGATWDVYTKKGSEPAWVSDLGPVRLLITGSGSDAEFAQLATAVLARPPLAG
jgi:hypothetical protein